MKKYPHVQWAFYDVDHMDYHISLSKKTLKNIEEWNIIKSKIVYLTDDAEDIKKIVQRKLFITLLTDEERRKELRETKFIRDNEKVVLKISNYLLNILIKNRSEDYEHRYDGIWNKIHFLTTDPRRPYNLKSWFDSTFRFCEKLNKKQSTTWDLFESEYINVHKPQ